MKVERLARLTVPLATAALFAVTTVSAERRTAPSIFQCSMCCARPGEIPEFVLG
jgi:hypothetical protein